MESLRHHVVDKQKKMRGTIEKELAPADSAQLCHLPGAVFSLSVARASTFFLQGCETTDERENLVKILLSTAYDVYISPFLKLVPVLQLLLLIRHCHSDKSKIIVTKSGLSE